MAALTTLPVGLMPEKKKKVKTGQTLNVLLGLLFLLLYYVD